MVPSPLVPCTAVARHSLVVYVGMVDPLILLVSCDGTTAYLFIHILVWRGVICGPCNNDQT